jgi:hypothetical protein
VEYYQGDTQMPIYSRASSGYPVGSIVKLLLTDDIQEHCTVQPLGVAENASFLIDLDSVDFHDLKADDLGVWSPTGTKRTYFRFSSSGILKFTNKKRSGAAANEAYFTLTRRYYVHKSYELFHREIADIEGIAKQYSNNK